MVTTMIVEPLKSLFGELRTMLFLGSVTALGMIGVDNIKYVKNNIVILMYYIVGCMVYFVSGFYNGHPPNGIRDAEAFLLIPIFMIMNLLLAPFAIATMLAILISGKEPEMNSKWQNYTSI